MCSIYRGGVISCGGDDDDGGSSSVAVTGVTLNKSTLSLAPGGSEKLTATVTPSDATNKEMVWETSDTTDKITVLQDGTVSVAEDATKGATATITVRSKDNLEKNDTCEVSVVGSAEEATVLNGSAGSYEAANGTSVTISGTGTVTVGDKSGEISSVTQNTDGTYTAKVTVDGTEYTITTDADGAITKVEADGKEIELTKKTEDSETPDNPDNPVNPVKPDPEPNPGDDENETVTYKASEITAAELSAMSISFSAGSSTTTSIATAGSYNIWNGKGVIITAAGKIGIKSDKNADVDSIVSSTNMTGATATAVPVVGANLSTIGGNLTNYVKVTPPSTGTFKVGMNYSLNASTKDLESFAGASYWILVTDTTGKILAVKDVGDIQQAANVVATTDADFGELTLAGDVCFGFARGGGSGGLLIHSLSFTSTTPAKATQTAPAAASFTANSAATGYSITISGADAEKATGLEYSTDGGTTWTAVTGTTITLTTYGTVKIRYAETEEKAASAAISVTVQEYKDESLDTPDAPAASKFTATGVATAGGKGSITIDSSITPTTLEYKLGTDGTVTAVTGATLSDLAAGDYYFRYKAVAGISNASEFTKVTVAAYVSPSVYTLTEASAEIVLGKTQVDELNYLSATATAKTNKDGSADSLTFTSVGGTEYTIQRFDLKKDKSIDAVVQGVKSFVVYVKSDGGETRDFDVKLDGTTVGSITCTPKITVNNDDGTSTSTDVFGYTFNTTTDGKTTISIAGTNASIYPLYIVVKNAASEIPVESVTITGKPASNTLIKGNSVTLGATVAPDRATAKTIAWSIENLENGTKSVEELAQIAKITDAGVLSAVGEGQVVVVATAPSGATGSFTLNVQGSAVYATGVTLKIGNDAAGDGGAWGKGKTFTLVPTVTADDNATPTDDTVSWSSNAVGVATVSSAGVVTVVAANGTATITATANGSETAGAVKATYVVTATPVYVVAGKYQLKTGALADGYTKANSVDDAGKVGLYAVFQAVTYTSGNSSKTQSAGKFDSKGFNSTTKDVSTEGAAGTNGIITFAINKKMTLKLKDAAATYRGFAVVATSGSNLITVGNASAVAKFSSTAGDEYTLTLESGEYKVYGNSDSGQCVIPEFIFEEVN